MDIYIFRININSIPRESELYSRDISSVVGKRLDRQVDAPAGRRVAEHGGARDDAFKTPSRKEEEEGKKKRSEG